MNINGRVYGDIVDLSASAMNVNSSHDDLNKNLLDIENQIIFILPPFTYVENKDLYIYDEESAQIDYILYTNKEVDEIQAIAINYEDYGSDETGQTFWSTNSHDNGKLFSLEYAGMFEGPNILQIKVKFTDGTYYTEDYKIYRLDPNNTDTDNDGLTNDEEYFIGTDKTKADTDGDGLTDYDEAYKTYTDPLKTDTDDNGISDGNEDFDEDLLINKDEVGVYNTNPYQIDTDKDGLTDYEEIFEQLTNPCNKDTDNDKIPDKDECIISLNPNNSETHTGIVDNNYIFDQIISEEILSDINLENDCTLSIDNVKSAGYANNSIIIEESPYTNVLKGNDSILGKIVNIRYDSNLDFESATLRFSINSSLLTDPIHYTDEEGIYGLQKFQIFGFDTENSLMYPVKTNYDTENNLIYTTVTEFGDYFVVNLDEWLYNLNININDTELRTAGAIDFLSTEETDEVEVIPTVTNNINGHNYAILNSSVSWVDAEVYSETLGGHLVTITDAFEQSFVYNLIKSLNESERKNVYWIGLTNVLGEWRWVTNEEFNYENWALKEPNNESENFVHIYGLKADANLVGQWNDTYNYTEGNDFHATSNSGFIVEFDEFDLRTYSLPSSLSLDSTTFGRPLIKDDEYDTDGDGLSDSEEVNWLLMAEYGAIIDSDGYVIHYPQISSVYDKYTQFLENLSDEIKEQIENQQIVPLISSITDEDTDGDGVADDEERIIETDSRSFDTDRDGLDDGTEVANWFDPLLSDPDGDGRLDKQEFDEDTDPFTYNKEWYDYLDDVAYGLVAGDFAKERDGIGVLIGQLVSGLIPISDARDAIANVVYGDYLFAGINLIGLIPVAGDITTTCGKAGKFFLKNADNIAECTDALIFLEKNMPDVAKALGKSDEFAEAVQEISKLDNIQIARKEAKVLLESAESAGVSKDLLKTSNGLNINRTIESGTDAWEMAPIERGNFWDEFINKHSDDVGLGQNFPVFDRREGDTLLISTKSLDVGAQSYRYPSRIKSQLNKYVRDMNGFKEKYFVKGKTIFEWGKTTLSLEEYNARKKVLEVVLPDIPINQKTQKVFEDFKTEIEKSGIEVWYIIGK